MAMAVSKDKKIALTVSADHLVGRYDLSVSCVFIEPICILTITNNLQAAQEQDDTAAACTVHRIKHPGNGSIALRDDGKVCAIGGWDGKYVRSVRRLPGVILISASSKGSACSQQKL